jgi:hypothetical protein
VPQSDAAATSMITRPSAGLGSRVRVRGGAQDNSPGRRIETRSLSGTSKSVSTPPPAGKSSPSARCTAATWLHDASIASVAAALAVSLVPRV